MTAEYRALRESAAVVQGRSAMVRVTGADAVEFLDGLLSQDLSELEPSDRDGAPVRSLLLAPQGKLRTLLWVAATPEAVLLVADVGAAEGLRADLARYRFRVDAEIGPVEEVLEVWGPRAGEVVAAAGLEASAAGAGTAVPGSLGSLPRWYLAGASADDLVIAGAIPAGALAAEAVRIEAGEPVMGVDVDEGTIPQESGLVPVAVSFDKGCYLGQELVARIDSRGHVNRLLRGIVVTTNVIPPLGAVVASGEGEVGRLSSVAESLTLRAPVGLALVRREVEPGTAVELRWEGGAVPARVDELPLDDFAVAV